MNRAIAILAGSLFALPALAQTNGLYNGGFEQLCSFGCGCNGPFAEGWHSPGCDSIANRRFVGDGLSPAFFPVGTPGALTPRTGDSVAELGTHGSGGFEGLTTDTVNFCHCDQTCQTACNPPFPFFDPYFDYNAGDVVVTAYYMIPADAPIPDTAGVKINIKVNFQDVATMEDLSITGHTDGQWVPLTLTFARSEIQRQYECNRGILPECGCNCVPETPLPNHAKLTLMRFVGDGTLTSGRVFWDDVTFTQLPAVTPCDPDVNCDGAVNGFDVEAMEQAVNGDFSNFCQADPDYNHDGAVNGFDIESVEQGVNGAPCP
ncbi:hypothetical protein PHYC_00601 [Phycisphaerales bacterium]|nr:hypothetical protein PHYC_00601 [Phycisphaerales bacterium]